MLYSFTATEDNFAWLERAIDNLKCTNLVGYRTYHHSHLFPVSAGLAPHVKGDRLGKHTHSHPSLNKRQLERPRKMSTYESFALPRNPLTYPHSITGDFACSPGATASPRINLIHLQEKKPWFCYHLQKQGMKQDLRVSCHAAGKRSG